jgi:predicted ATPase/DNA-binding XRE family transcriptional regulator
LDAVSSFGTWLKRQRKALDVTQAELARRLGCATITLQKIELDERRPSKQLAERLAEALSVPPAQRPAFLRSARGAWAANALSDEARQAPALRPQHNLPPQPTSFIGRGREVSLALALLRHDDVRLLTLTGPGGTGKTRVSIQLAPRLLDAYSDGIWFVSLAAIRDPAMVPSVIAAVLGLREVTGQPLAERLQTYLATKQMLLILDNFEQVLPAAALVAELLAAAPRLKALVTSRSVLGVYGEQLVSLPPLGLPSPEYAPTVEQAAQSEAIALFLARARAANHGFELTPANVPAVAELCRRLDGLPLAIELAAARSRLLPPQALLQRLGRRLQLLTGGPRTLPARQQTLRATLDWSYDLLTPAERALFRRLAVFEGSWAVEAAEQICIDDRTQPLDIVDGLASLNDKSLLSAGATPEGDARFSMLETIREYALERLAASGEEAALRERHARYYLRWLEAMHARYQSGARHQAPGGQDEPQQDPLTARVRAELGNLASTVRWITDYGPWSLALPWEDATQSFWFVERLGWVSQAWRRWHQDLIDSCGVTPVRTWVEALVRIGRFAYWHDLSQAAALLEEGLELARALDDAALIMLAVEWLGHAYRDQDMYARAIPLYQEYMARAQARGELFDIASAHHCLGELALLQEDYPRALEQAGASFPIFQSLNVEWGIACASIHQGFAALHLGNDELAARCFPLALRVAQRYDGGSHIRGALAGFAALAARGGARGSERAARLFGAIAGRAMVHAHRRTCEPFVVVARARLGPAWEAAYAEGQRMTLEQAAAYALEPLKSET